MPAANDASVPGSRPAVRGRAHEAVDDGGHPERGRDGSGEIEVAGAPLGLGQEARREPHHGQPDGHVDEEAPAPREQVGQQAAEHQADAAAATCDGAVVGDGARALAALAERRRQQRERGRCGDRGADALHGARGQQPLGRGRQAAREGGGGEESDAGHEHAPAAEDVAGPRAQQQQAAERQRVGVLHPREGRGREVQRRLDLGQGRDHDRDVEDDHQVRGQDDREDRRRVRPRAQRARRST